MVKIAIQCLTCNSRYDVSIEKGLENFELIRTEGFPFYPEVDVDVVQCVVIGCPYEWANGDYDEKKIKDSKEPLEGR